MGSKAKPPIDRERNCGINLNKSQKSQIHLHSDATVHYFNNYSAELVRSFKAHLADGETVEAEGTEKGPFICKISKKQM